jgi:hypothetical protein
MFITAMKAEKLNISSKTNENKMWTPVMKWPITTLAFVSDLIQDFQYYFPSFLNYFIKK